MTDISLHNNLKVLNEQKHYDNESHIFLNRLANDVSSFIIRDHSHSVTAGSERDVGYETNDDVAVVVVVVVEVVMQWQWQWQHRLVFLRKYKSI
jgi:hypothetical protein